MSPTHEPSATLPRSAVMAMLDEAMVQAASARVNGGNAEHRPVRAVVAVDLHLSFMRPATDQAVATAQVVGGGKTMVFCEAQLRNAEGDVVAQAMGTYRAQSHD